MGRKSLRVFFFNFFFLLVLWEVSLFCNIYTFNKVMMCLVGGERERKLVTLAHIFIVWEIWHVSFLLTMVTDLPLTMVGEKLWLIYFLLIGLSYNCISRSRVQFGEEKKVLLSSWTKKLKFCNRCLNEAKWDVSKEEKYE